jgi:hypothetical protein
MVWRRGTGAVMTGPFLRIEVESLIAEIRLPGYVGQRPVVDVPLA